MKLLITSLRIAYHAFMAGFYDSHAHYKSPTFTKWAYHSNQYVNLINQLKETQS